MTKKISYKDAGVDIEAGKEAVRRIKSAVRTTFNDNVLTDIGKFGGFFMPDIKGYAEPVLVSSIDGVGTKLKVAIMTGKHDTIGEDLVNHSVNDILVGGARPLFFLDYIGTCTLKPDAVEQIISGMVRGCKNNGCALIGGEMAEMPGFYKEGDYDLAGSITGIVDKKDIIDGREIKDGDMLLGLPSSGLHTNGYSLARKVLFDAAGYKPDTYIDALGTTVAEALLAVHKSYLNVISPLLGKVKISGMSHITGGGIIGNTIRVLPDGLTLKIDWRNWTVPPVFRLIQEAGNVPDEEMRKTFNLGIGFILIIRPEVVTPLMKILEDEGEEPVVIGTVQAGRA
ncbi:phosphoribosylformylglycinamidine cyclo-ligase [bacterium]|nr:phosphoribosylformylglycinamidine cyclo-ligase [bacterium]